MEDSPALANARHQAHVRDALESLTNVLEYGASDGALCEERDVDKAAHHLRRVRRWIRRHIT